MKATAFCRAAESYDRRGVAARLASLYDARMRARGQPLESVRSLRQAMSAFCLLLLWPTATGNSFATKELDTLVRSLRERARKVNGFAAQLSVRAGGASQTGTLVFLAPDHVHMDLKVAGLGPQRVMSDGHTLWTITPQARLATKIDLEAVQRSWNHPLPNQVTAVRDVFEVIRPGSVRLVKDEQVDGVHTRLFEGVPAVGIEVSRNTALPDRMRAWVGDDGLLRRQVLLRGGEVLMDATFQITDTNPRIGPGLFTFDPPADFQVQDLTQSTIQTLRSLEGK